jgi:hypothetical protein
VHATWKLEFSNRHSSWYDNTYTLWDRSSSKQLHWYEWYLLLILVWVLRMVILTLKCDVNWWRNSELSSMTWCLFTKTKNWTTWPECASELYRPSDRHLSAKLMPTFVAEGCRYFFFQVAPKLYSRGRVDPVPDPLFLRKSGSAGNRARTSGTVARNSDH